MCQRDVMFDKGADNYGLVTGKRCGMVKLGLFTQSVLVP